MNPDSKHTAAQQLRLAARILETGHPWGYQIANGGKARSYTSPLEVIADYDLLIPLLATPPDGRSLHNPDNLTAEAVGVGFRLLLPEEVDGRHKDKCQVWNGFGAWSSSSAEGTNVRYSYRLPLSVPWPPAPVDPYASLKAAHAAGKVIQSYNRERGGIWQDCPSPAFEGGTDYRIKPEEPFQLPPPPPGIQWHRVDGWKDRDLPQGTRPMCAGETYLKGDGWRMFDGWQLCKDDKIISVWPRAAHSRTTRPLIFQHEGKSWTWHRPGDPMPCDGGARIEIVCHEGRTTDIRGIKYLPRTARSNRWDQTLGWRYAEPATKEVELGPEDVPPNSVFRGAGEAKDPDDKGWCLITSCSKTGIRYWRQSDFDPTELSWKTLRESGAEINRPRHRDAKGKPTLWEPCHKTITIE